MTFFQAIILAILQGATELFPVSSLGHAVVAPALLHWPVHQRGEDFLPFLVMLHLGTAVALLAYFRRDWQALAMGALNPAHPQQCREARRILLLIAVATLPAVIVGFALRHILEALFATPLIAALMLVANGFLLLLGEKLRARPSPVDGEQQALSSLSVRDALIIGLWQCAALVPGISRSGSTIVGGLLRGVDHARAAHFSFLIALPIIAGATVLEVPKLLHASVPAGVFSQALAAAIASGCVAYLSTAFLMRYFRQHDSWALTPFAFYCIAAGGSSAAFLVLIG